MTFKAPKHPLDKRKNETRAAASTSWEPVADWYTSHHDETGTLLSDVAYPGVLKLLSPTPGKRYLDVACGEGAFSRLLVKSQVHVSGFDAAPSLITRAKSLAPEHTAYAVGDARAFEKLYHPESFDGATCILAIQNIDRIDDVFTQVARVLKPGASFVIAMNHPAFRIPGASSWGYEGNRKMYRRIDRYLSTFELPIQAHPGSDPSLTTPSYHRPFSTFVNSLTQAGFALTGMEEWVSNRLSKQGARSDEENRTRKEFPIFLGLRAEKR